MVGPMPRGNPRVHLRVLVSPTARTWLEGLGQKWGLPTAEAIRAALWVAAQHENEVEKRLRDLSDN